MESKTELNLGSSQPVTINRTGVMVPYIGETYGWGKFETDSGDVLYSMDLDTEWAEPGQRLYPVVYDDAGLALLLSTGYPYGSIRANDDMDRFVTQAAVWLYCNGEESVSDDFLHGADPYQLMDTAILPLVKMAQQGSPDNVKLDLPVATCDGEMMVEGKEGLCSSPEVNVSVPADTVASVSLEGDLVDGGGRVVDERGDERYQFGDGESFTIEVPRECLISRESVQVEVEAVKEVPHVVAYRTSLEDNYEHLVGLNEDPVVVTTTLSIPVNSPAVLLGDVGLMMGFIVFAGTLIIACSRLLKRNKQ